MTTQPKKLIDRISQGDWSTSRDAVPEGHIQITVYTESDGLRVATVFRDEANAELIAMAPKLLRENEQLREALKEVVNQLTTLRSEYYRQGVTLTNEQVNMGSAALLQAKAALGEK